MPDSRVRAFGEHAVVMSIEALCNEWINSISKDARESFSPEEIERYSNLHAEDILKNLSHEDRINYFVDQAHRLAPRRDSLILFDFLRREYKDEFERSVLNAWREYQKYVIKMIMPLDGGYGDSKI